MLQELILEQTAKSPAIEFNHLTGNLILSGKSIPENVAKVYEPAYNWVQEYISNASPNTNLRINLDYYNSASSIWLTKILKTLMKINKPDYVLIIHLYLPIEEFEEIDNFDDIKDAFLPVSNIDQNALLCIGIKVYGTDSNGEVIKETMVFI